MFLRSTFVFAYITLCKTSTNYTVKNANKYIAANNDAINQQYRSSYHFNPPIGWMNDPNGFIYYKGEYHLFYQFNPYNTTHYKIHWGHAKSNDLLTWQNLPVALAPDQPYDNDGVFSGSAIEKDGKLYLMYTGYSQNGQVQCVAVSDDGVTFQKVPENPVLNAASLPPNAQSQDFRDPKVFKRSDLYYAVLASKTKTNTGQILLYQSTDLINWRYKSILLEGTQQTGVMWECPDLFELDGKDVLLVSPIEIPRSGYDYHNYDSVIGFVGRVNWETGTMSVETTQELDHGMDFYAAQSLLDDKGRRIVIAWMSMWRRNYPTRTHGWIGAMTIPRQLHLTNSMIVQKPACEFQSFFKNTKVYTNVALDNENEFDTITGDVGVLDFVIYLQHNTVFTLELRKSKMEKTTITYDTNTETLQLDRRRSGILVTGAENPPVFSRKVHLPLKNNTLKLVVLIDRSSVEVFANEGVETMTANIYPENENSNGISCSVYGRGVIRSVRFYYSRSSEATPFVAMLLLAFFVVIKLY